MTESRSSLALGVGVRGLTAKKHEETFTVSGMYCNVDCGGFYHIIKYVIKIRDLLLFCQFLI